VAARVGGPIPASASLVPPFVPPPARLSPSPGGSGSPGAMCRAAITAAEQRYGVPAGLLLAIGTVESGRRDGPLFRQQGAGDRLGPRGAGRRDALDRYRLHAGEPQPPSRCLPLARA